MSDHGIGSICTTVPVYGAWIIRPPPMAMPMWPRGVVTPLSSPGMRSRVARSDVGIPGLRDLRPDIGLGVRHPWQ